MRNYEHLKQLLKLIVFLGLSSLLISCETVSYYSQAARGQLHILTSRQAISDLLADATIDNELKEKLRLAAALKQFAVNELGLPATNNFDTYVELERDHVVWNVFATPEFSLNPVNWCYPIAGCVSYRGYFDEENAQRYASKLQQEGYDVYTGGVDAYSTLGWFDDPLLSTVMSRADYQLAGLIFHELAHQVVYLKGDTTFNESFATAVEREGVKRWLRSTEKTELLSSAQQDQARQAEFLQLVIVYQERFDDLYEQQLPDAQKRIAKTGLQGALRTEYEQIKTDWEGYAGYDSWIYDSLNNAQLSTVASYNSLVPFFSKEIESVDGNLAAFYALVTELASMEALQRQQFIDAADPLE
ncbi:MAG: putative aminopeptidase [Pseudohongiellaceae bacterium]